MFTGPENVGDEDVNNAARRGEQPSRAVSFSPCPAKKGVAANIVHM
jgi:hypothetical protein